jgi:hypothetical protein
MAKVIKISSYMSNKIKVFADARVNGSKKLYNFRGKSSNEKLIEDVVVGAMGEYATYMYLKAKKFQCTKPDYSIYEVANKSYSRDMMCNNKHLHIKSQSTASTKRYGHSWICQKSDKLVKDPDINDYLAFTEVCLLTNTVKILGFCNAKLIKTIHGWQECKVPMFRHSKVALYYNYLDKYGIVSKSLFADSYKYKKRDLGDDVFRELLKILDIMEKNTPMQRGLSYED